MNIEPNYLAETSQFRERYRALSDNDLALLAMDQNLIPPAREAITNELDARGLRDLSAFRTRFEEDDALIRAAGGFPLLPPREVPADTKDSRYLGIAGFVIIGLIGIHKLVLGDAITWSKEGTLFLLLFFALIFTWDPIIKIITGRATFRLVCWLTLGLLYFGVMASVLAVPALGRVVANLDPMVVLAFIASPGIVQVVMKAAQRFSVPSV